jgi:hypothetical protein
MLLALAQALLTLLRAACERAGLGTLDRWSIGINQPAP